MITSLRKDVALKINRKFLCVCVCARYKPRAGITQKSTEIITKKRILRWMCAHNKVRRLVNI